MKAELVLAPQSERLAALAATVNREHDLTFASAVDALRHAILCGEALIDLREVIPDGEWERWVQNNLTIGSSSQLRRYVRLATHKDALLAAGVVLPSVPAALGYLNQLGVPNASGGTRVRFDVVEARRLRGLGMTYAAIAALVGTTPSSVMNQLNPGYRKKVVDRKRRYRKREAAARKVLEIQERGSAVRKAGDLPAEAYALLRRCALAIDQALLDADDEQREQLRAALASTHKAEDAIVRALRIGRQS